MPRATRTRNPYQPHPSIARARAVVAGMKAKTGRSLEEWVAHVRGKGPADEAARAAWLVAEHGLGTNYAAWIAASSFGKGGEDTDQDVYLRNAVQWVEAMFTGPKSVLRPVYEALLDAVFELGKQVKVCPCQTIVPVFRNHVIAQVKVATRTRIDFGLALARHQGRLPKRLIDTGGKDRITHKIELAAPEHVDADLRKWLRAAYDLDAEAD